MNVGELKARLADLPDPCEPLPDDAVPGIVLWPNY